jgi:hypothetical protein
MVSPIVNGINPFSIKRETSLSEKPPSGPITSATIPGILLR